MSTMKQTVTDFIDHHSEMIMELMFRMQTDPDFSTEDVELEIKDMRYDETEVSYVKAEEGLITFLLTNANLTEEAEVTFRDIGASIRVQAVAVQQV